MSEMMDFMEFINETTRFLRDAQYLDMHQHIICEVNCISKLLVRNMLHITSINILVSNVRKTYRTSHVYEVIWGKIWLVWTGGTK